MSNEVKDEVPTRSNTSWLDVRDWVERNSVTSTADITSHNGTAFSGLTLTPGTLSVTGTVTNSFANSFTYPISGTMSNTYTQNWANWDGGWWEQEQIREQKKQDDQVALKKKTDQLEIRVLMFEKKFRQVEREAWIRVAKHKRVCNDLTLYICSFI